MRALEPDDGGVLRGEAEGGRGRDMKTPRLRGAWRGVSSAHSALRREGIDRRWAGGTPVFARTFWGDVGPRALRLSDTIDRPVCLPVQWNPLIFPN